MGPCIGVKEVQMCTELKHYSFDIFTDPLTRGGQLLLSAGNIGLLIVSRKPNSGQICFFKAKNEALAVRMWPASRMWPAGRILPPLALDPPTDLWPRLYSTEISQSISKF